MKIAKTAIAGTLESSDAMITLTPIGSGVTIEVESVVFEQFGADIERALREVLDTFSVGCVKVHVRDQGAVECVLKALLETAIIRAGKEAES